MRTQAALLHAGNQMKKEKNADKYQVKNENLLIPHFPKSLTADDIH